MLSLFLWTTLPPSKGEKANVPLLQKCNLVISILPGTPTSFHAFATVNIFHSSEQDWQIIAWLSLNFRLKTSWVALYSVVCECVRHRCHQTKSPLFPIYTVDRFIKTFFWNFQKCKAGLCYILIDKQMLEKVFSSNITPLLSSRNHLFYKAEYMGRVAWIRFWP